MAGTVIDLTNLTDMLNECFVDELTNKDRYLILYGGAGSGKSVFAAQKVIIRCLKEPGHRFLIVRKVARTLRHSVFAEIRKCISDWGLTPLFSVNKSDMEIICENGSSMIFIGCDDPDKLKSITGITSVWIEEADALTQSDFQEVDRRLRGRSRYYKQIILTFNPTLASHWLKEYFFDNPPPNSHIHHSTYLDNRFIDREYAKMLDELKERDINQYNIYACGNWGSLGELILTNWEVKDIPLEDTEYQSIYCGLDFGFNHPSAFVKLGFKDGDIYVLGELKEKKLTNAELMNLVATRFGKSYLITADSAEPDRIKEFKQHGFIINPATKGVGSVKAQLDWLKSQKIYIHPSCQGFVAEIKGYAYRKLKDGTVLDEPVDYADDLMAALRYGIEPVRIPQQRAKMRAGRSIYR